MTTRFPPIIAILIVWLCSMSAAYASEPKVELQDNPDVPLGLLGVELGYDGPVQSNAGADYVGKISSAHIELLMPLGKRTTLFGGIRYNWGDVKDGMPVYNADFTSLNVRVRFYIGTPKDPVTK